MQHFNSRRLKIYCSKKSLVGLLSVSTLFILLFFIEIPITGGSLSPTGLARNDSQIISMKTSEFPQDHLGVTEPLLPTKQTLDQAALPGKRELNPIGGELNFLPVEFLEKGYKLQKAVARITNQYGENGTGFLISPSILLTNNHVISTPTAALKSTFTFNYQNFPNGTSGLTDTYTANTSIFHTSPVKDKDYTIIKLNNDPGKNWGHIPLPTDSFEDQMSFITRYWGTPIHANIIQHPDGRLKEVAIQDNILTNVSRDKGYVRYTTDTEGGASGAPVFDNNWNLIALHHANGDKETVSVSPISPDTSNFYIQKEIYLNNEGILASSIVEDLYRTYSKDQAGAKILKELGLEFVGISRGLMSP